jgi:hypothetical protein
MGKKHVQLGLPRDAENPPLVSVATKSLLDQETIPYVYGISER